MAAQGSTDPTGSAPEGETSEVAEEPEESARTDDAGEPAKVEKPEEKP